jgi:AcrR family transcriptional regulator
MPKTRTQVPKDAKVDEIVAAAERRLRSKGYDALSVAAISRELGLAQNAIYWYFPSKDHLFVAALERLLRDIAARKPSRSKDDVERILWFTDQFALIWGLQGAMAERARSSQAVADFVRNLDEMLSRMLTNAFRGHVSDDQLPLAVETFRSTIEGTFVKRLARKERDRQLRFVLARVWSQ